MAITQADIKRLKEAHGHVCFGLAVGYRAALIAKKEFDIDVMDDYGELITIMEENGCCEDAIQLITTCNWHRGNLILQKCGKFVFIFYNRTTGKSMRLNLRDEIRADYEKLRQVKPKIVDKTATEKEKDIFWRLSQQQVEKMLNLADDQLFQIEKFSTTLLVKLSKFESLYVPSSLNTCPCKDGDQK